MACSQQDPNSQTAVSCLAEAEAALANDSIRQGETLLRKTIHLAEVSEDWHTDYIAYQRLAEALSQSNPEEALRLMKQALTIYEQHPDDEHNYVILLDYAGTFAAQLAFINEGPFDEALDFTNRAYDIARKNQMTDLMCQTLTSLANIAWAKEEYYEALNYAHQAESVATDDLRPGTLQVLARSYLDLDMLDSAETVSRQIEPGSTASGKRSGDIPAKLHPRTYGGNEETQPERRFAHLSQSSRMERGRTYAQRHRQ